MEGNMNRHRTDSILLTENIKLDVIHEANPYFAGERISVVVRLEHLGSEEEHSRLKARIDDLERRVESRSTDDDKSRDGIGANGRQGSSLVQSLFSAFLGEKRYDFEDEESTEPLREQTTYNDQLKRALERQLKLHEPVDLLSGYLQVVGFFHFDSNLIDEEKINYNTSKLPGLARLITQHTNTQFLVSKSDQSKKSLGSATTNTTTTTTTNNNDLNDDIEATTHGMSERLVNTVKFFNSDFSREFPASRPFPSSTDYSMASPNQTNIKSPPIFLIPQTLLFPEVKLCPGDVRTFHFRSKRLPLDMCPSYEGSENVGVSYSLEFGANLIKDDVIQPLSSLIPITVAPYVSPRGYQYTAKLDGDVYVTSVGSIRDISNSELLKNGSQSPVSFSSLNAATGPRSRSSTTQSSISVSREKRKQLKQKFIELVQLLDGTRHIEDLVDLELETQFGGLLDPPSSDENISEPNYFPHAHKDSARVNLENLINMPIGNLLNEEAQREEEVEVEVEVEAEVEVEGEEANGEQDLGEGKPELARRARKRAVSIVAPGRLSPQLRNLQKSYIINKNGVQVAHVNFSRYFYTTSDDIQLTVDFKTGNFNEESSAMVSGVSATLELIEKLNPNFFASEFSVSNDGQSIIPITASHSTVFDRTDIVPITIVIPRTPRRRIASQFKTNIFDVRWAVSLRFVLINKSSENNMLRFYEDKRGTLLHSKDTIEGEEFICRIPVVIIPSPASF